MHILITGASGLLGRRLAQTLSLQDHRITGLYCNHPTWVADRVNIAYYQCDLSREYELMTLFARHELRPEVIVHCAALTDVDRCEEDKILAYATNVLSTRHIFRASVRVDARLIYISTPSVFPGCRGGYAEDDVPSPSNFYSLTKLLGEEVVLSRPGSLIIRADILGIHPVRRQGKNLMEWLVRMVGQNNDLKLFYDVRTNPISDITLAEIIEALLSYDGEENIFHFGSSDIVSKADIGRLVIEYFQDYNGDVQEVSVESLGLTAARPKEMWLDTRKTVQELRLKLPTAQEEINRILHGAGATRPITADAN